MIKHSLTWEKQKRDLVKQTDYLTFGLVRTGICVMLQNDALDYEYIANLPNIWKSPTSADAPNDMTMFGRALGNKLTSEKIQLLDTGEKRDFEWTTHSGFTFRFIVELVFDRENGREVFTTVKDLTIERQRENVLRTLLKEVSHRSKNLLAMVQSVAFQTARHSDSLERFIERFRGRIQSLSYSQDSITQNDWQGSQIAQLIDQQKSLFSPRAQKLIVFEGPNVLLSPNITMHLGLALHELISNATSYGSFVEKNNKIMITVNVIENENGIDDINVCWTEIITREPQTVHEIGFEPKKQFGSILLERIVPSAVCGKADLIFDGDKMIYNLKFPQSIA